MRKYQTGGLTDLPLEEWMAREDGSCTYQNYLDNPNYEEPKMSEEIFNLLKQEVISRKRNAMLLPQQQAHRQRQAFEQWVHGNAQAGHTYQDYVHHQAILGLPPLTEVEFNDIANNQHAAVGPSPPMQRRTNAPPDWEDLPLGGKSKKYRKRPCKKYKKKSCKKRRKRSYRKK